MVRHTLIDTDKSLKNSSIDAAGREANSAVLVNYATRIIKRMTS